jgi:hypothetical protein
MALDPRLASVELLTLAALRAKQRQATHPGEAVVGKPAPTPRQPSAAASERLQGWSLDNDPATL